MNGDSECFDKLVQMRGSMSWNPLLDEWVVYVKQEAGWSSAVFETDADPLVAVSKAHTQWLRREAEVAA